MDGSTDDMVSVEVKVLFVEVSELGDNDGDGVAIDEGGAEVDEVSRDEEAMRTDAEMEGAPSVVADDIDGAVVVTRMFEYVCAMWA